MGNGIAMKKCARVPADLLHWFDVGISVAVNPNPERVVRVDGNYCVLEEDGREVGRWNPATLPWLKPWLENRIPQWAAASIVARKYAKIPFNAEDANKKANARQQANALKRDIELVDVMRQRPKDSALAIAEHVSSVREKWNGASVTELRRKIALYRKVLDMLCEDPTRTDEVVADALYKPYQGNKGHLQTMVAKLRDMPKTS
jgi:hypothetical protein